MLPTNTRILIVDDNTAIHDDFRKILAPDNLASRSLDELEAQLFDTPAPTDAVSTFELTSAMQGEDALREVVEANAAGKPFALAFIDMRMPPGWDGLETAERIWAVDPYIQIVICSAYSDYSWSDMRTRLGPRESLLILKKPFDTIEAVQCAHALTTKWTMARQLRAHVHSLEAAVAARTQDLLAANVQLGKEMHERERIAGESRLAQKLEAVGQLAAGIAHELNTPIQYVGDNLQFLREGMTDLVGATTHMLETAATTRTEATAALVDRMTELAATADLEFLATHLPDAFTSIDNGVKQISTIVRAMKELAHPGKREAAAVDIERTLTNALVVTANSYRSIADVETDFASSPSVTGFGSEISQVFLNLIVNAAHAMEDRPEQRGTLRVTTRVDGDDIVVTIGDTGCGIPEANRERIFDPFFTTKELGRGTGQGLAISRSIVVERHGGTLTFESEVGVGSVFTVRLPIAGPRRDRLEQAREEGSALFRLRAAAGPGNTAAG